MRKMCLALVLLVIASPLIADQTCKPVDGHFEAVVVPPGGGDNNFCPPDPQAFCTAGRVWGGIQGNYQFVMMSLIPSGAVPTVFFFTGKSTIFLKSDDQVFGTDTGSIDLFGLGGFASLITFNGGTGEMSTAKGQIRLRGQLTATGTAGDYLGTLCTQ